MSEDPIVFVGGGLAGTMTLVHELMNIAQDPTITEPVNILQLERKPEQLNGGIAYAQTPPPPLGKNGKQPNDYRLNLPSKRARTFPDFAVPPGLPSFSEYLVMMAETDERYRDYLQDPPRPVFGQYLTYLVESAKHMAGDKVNFEVRYAEAVAVDVDDGGKVRSVQTSDGDWIKTPHAILATGFKESVQPTFLRDVFQSGNSAYLDDPYAPSAGQYFKERVDQQQAGQNERTLIIGTGLSAMDAAIRLIEMGYEGEIVLLSRHGETHPIYGRVGVDDYLKEGMTGEPRPDRQAELSKTRPQFADATTERDLVRSFAREFRDLTKKQGYYPEEVLEHWERFIPDVASHFPEEVVERLYTKNASWLACRRVGTTPRNGEIIEEAMQRGQITLATGHIHAVEPNEQGGLSVHYTPNHCKNPEDAKPTTMQCSGVVSAIGYSVDYFERGEEVAQHMQAQKTRISDPLWHDMQEKGLYRRHFADGIRVTDDYAIIDSNDRPLQGLSAIGVPVCGHVAVSTGRLPPFYLNIVGICETAPVLAQDIHRGVQARQQVVQAASQSHHDLPPGILPAGHQSAASLEAHMRQPRDQSRLM